MDAEDSELVVRSKDGDLQAFNFIVQRYQSQVLNLSARIIGDRGRAEDVTQETFISAYQAIGRFRGGSLRAWLMRIAANASRDSLRGSRQRPEQSWMSLSKARRSSPRPPKPPRRNMPSAAS